jgi:hypothetical protein
MWFNIVKTIVFSLIIIIVIHSLYQHIKDILVPKKTRDLVELQVQKYKDILCELQEKQHYVKEEEQEEQEDTIPEINYTNMEDDLIKFANSQITSSNDGLM